MLERAWKLVRENVSAAISVLSLLGFGSAIAVADDARAMLVEHPGSALLLIGFAFAFGVGFSELTFNAGERVAQKRKLDRLSRTFAAMPGSQRDLVRAALCGSVSTAAESGPARALCDAGILVASSVTWNPRVSEYSINPDIVFEIRDHKAEWLGV